MDKHSMKLNLLCDHDHSKTVFSQGFCCCIIKQSLVAKGSEVQKKRKREGVVAEEGTAQT